MGSSVSSHNLQKISNTTETSTIMQKTIAQQVIPNGEQALQSSFAPRPLKGILKNKQNVQIYERPIEKPVKPVKLVELYVLRGNEWKVTRVREDELEGRKKELKSDKTVKRTYTKPIHDQTFLHFQPF